MHFTRQQVTSRGTLPIPGLDSHFEKRSGVDSGAAKQAHNLAHTDLLGV